MSITFLFANILNVLPKFIFRDLGPSKNTYIGCFELKMFVSSL